MNGIAQVRAGAYTGLAFTREIPPEESDYEVGEPAPTPVPLEMSVSATLLEDEPGDDLPFAPSAVTSPISAPAGQGELRLVNYIGETLTFTIDDQVYSVAGGGGRLTLFLVPGEYTFTASTPRAGANGSVRAKAGIATRVSVALDVHNGRMSIYTK
jgi:hypothetical protein